MISMLTALAALAGAQLSQVGPGGMERLPADIAPRYVAGDMLTPHGADIGVTTLTRTRDGVTIRLELNAGALQPGRYDVFVQARASCAKPAKRMRQGAFVAPKAGRINTQFLSPDIVLNRFADAPLLGAEGVAVVIGKAGRDLACAEIRG